MINGQFTKSNFVCKLAKLGKLKKRRLKTENILMILKTTIALFKKIELMKKVYSEYVNCLIGEIRCSTKATIFFYQVLAESRYYATGSPQRLS